MLQWQQQVQQVEELSVAVSVVPSLGQSLQICAKQFPFLAFEQPFPCHHR